MKSFELQLFFNPSNPHNPWLLYLGEMKMVEEIKKILCPRVPWAFFIEEEDMPQVGPIVYHCLTEFGLKESVPVQVLAELEKIYNDTMARNLIFLEELKKILKTLGENKIEVILLKGMALIMQGVYSNPALRPMTDIDLLVRPSDFQRLKAVLNNMGYDDITWGPEDFIKNVNGMLIDIDVHTNFINVTRIPSRAKVCDINVDELWKNAREVKIDEIPLNSPIPPFIKGDRGGFSALVLSPVDFLIDLAVHSVIHHGMSGLLWFLDVIYFLEYHKEIDWNEVIVYARKNRTNRFLYYTLRYINEMLEMNIKPSTTADLREGLSYIVTQGLSPEFEKLRPEKIGLVENRILKRILNGKNNPYDKFLFTLCSIAGINGKLAFLKEAIFPPIEILRFKYNTKGRFYPYIAHFRKISNLPP